MTSQRLFHVNNMFILEKTQVPRKYEKPKLIWYLFNKCGWLGSYSVTDTVSLRRERYRVYEMWTIPCLWDVNDTVSLRCERHRVSETWILPCFWDVNVTVFLRRERYRVSETWMLPCFWDVSDTVSRRRECYRVSETWAIPCLLLRWATFYYRGLHQTVCCYLFHRYFTNTKIF